MPTFQDTVNSHEKLALQDDISVVKETTLKRLTEVKKKKYSLIKIRSDFWFTNRSPLLPFGRE